MIKVDRDNKQMIKITEALKVGTLTEAEKLDAAAFKAAHSSTQKLMLKEAFEQAMKKCDVQITGNFRCFLEGHGDRQASMIYNRDKKGFFCFGCSTAGKLIDVFDLIEVVHEEKGFMNQKNKAKKLFVNGSSDDGAKKSWKKYPLPMYKVMGYHFHHPIESDELALIYLKEHRGISKETAVEMGLRTWEYEGGHWYLLMVNDDGSYVRRKFYEDKEKSRMYCNEPAKWLNSKGSMGIFNLRAIETARAANQIIYVTESAMDAMSLVDVGLHAVGLNGLNNVGILARSTDYPYLVYILDNDKAGIEAAERLRVEGRCVVDVSRYEHLGQFKDINEALVADRQKFLNDMVEIGQDAVKHWG